MCPSHREQQTGVPSWRLNLAGGVTVQVRTVSVSGCALAHDIRVLPRSIVGASCGRMLLWFVLQGALFQFHTASNFACFSCSLGANIVSFLSWVFHVASMIFFYVQFWGSDVSVRMACCFCTCTAHSLFFIFGVWIHSCGAPFLLHVRSTRGTTQWLGRHIYT